MDSRSRNRRVVIKAQAAGEDDNGQPNGAWVEVVTVRANVRYLRGIEAIKAGAETSISQASINIAYRTNVTTAMRAYLGSTEFRITAVLPDEANKMHTDLTCEVIT